MTEKESYTKYEQSDNRLAFRQGEIITDIVRPQHEQFSFNESGEIDSISTELVNHSYSMILTQSCDLEGDFIVKNNSDIVQLSNVIKSGKREGKQLGQKEINNLKQQLADKKGKYLNSILLCEVYTAQNIRHGEDGKHMGSDEWSWVKKK